MPETMNIQLPKLLREEADFFIKAGLYSSRDELIREALRYYLRNALRANIDVAVELYKKDEISLGKAAEIAGVGYEDMRQILKVRGIKVKVGPESIKEAEAELERLEKRQEK